MLFEDSLSRVRYKRGKVFVAVVVLIHLKVLLLCSCASHKLHLSLTEVPPGIEATNLSWSTPDGNLSIDGFRVTCPGEVEEAEFDPENHTVLVKYVNGSGGKKKSEDGRFVLYDLDSNKVRWAGSGNPRIVSLVKGMAILNYGEQVKVLDASNGTLLQDLESNFMVFDDGVALILTSKKYSRVDLTTGEELWQREGSNWAGWLSKERSEDWMYVVADGLHAFRLDTGKGWYFHTSTSYKGVLEAYAKDLALGCIAGFFGYQTYGHHHEKLTHNLSSYPLEIDGRVYFAARDKVFCFDRETGEILWDNRLKNELGVMTLVDAGEYVALIGEGYKWVDFEIEKAVVPSVFLFRRDSGELVAQSDLEDASIILDFAWLENQALVLTPTHVYRLGHDLSILGGRDATTQEGQLLRFLSSTEDQVTVRTSQGVLALLPASFDVTWNRNLGSAPKGFIPQSGWKEGAQAVYDKVAEKVRSWPGPGIYWLTNLSNRLTGIDLENEGETVLEIDLATEDFEFSPSGNVFALRDNSVTIIQLGEDVQTRDIENSEEEGKNVSQPE